MGRPRILVRPATIVCTICAIEKPSSEYRDKQRQCKECLRAKHQKWVKDNRAHCTAYTRDRRRVDPEPHRAKVKEWQKNNPDKVSVSAARGYRKHALERQQYAAKWKSENKEKLRADNRAYKQANLDKHQNNEATRRARKLGAQSSGVSRAEWQQILDKFENKCAYCKIALNELTPRDRTQDHVIPLVKGGPHSPDNVVPACRRCNLKKNSTSVEDFIKRHFTTERRV